MDTQRTQLLSPVIKRGQLTLDFEPGLTERYRNVRECVAAGVYRRGLKRVAADLNEAPGNLSAQLGDESSRSFCVDSLERYIETTGDVTPIHYLVAKYIGEENSGDDKVRRARAMLETALQELGTK